MNPQDQNQPSSDTPTPQFGAPDAAQPTPAITPNNDTAQSTAVSSDDAAALQQIESLESETTAPTPDISFGTPTQNDSTVEPLTPVDSVAPTVPVTTPVDAPVSATDAQPEATPTPVTPAEAAATGLAAAVGAKAGQSLADTPASTATTQPQPAAAFGAPNKKSSKTLLFVLIAVLVVAAGVAAYFFWQSAQATDTTSSDDSSEVITPEVNEPTGGDLPGGNETPVQATDPEAEAPAPVEDTTLANPSAVEPAQGDTTVTP